MRIYFFFISLIFSGLVFIISKDPFSATRDYSVSVTLAQEKPLEFYSNHLESEIIILPGVVIPNEAENYVLPFMKENHNLFKGKNVLDIGTGAGIIGLYAAKLGAKKVIATDIEKVALDSTIKNAKKLNVTSILETRLVPQTDISAYSVIRPNETFDIIISNPPYNLDLDAMENTEVTDTGDLGFSIIRGLARHLHPKGKAILFYNSIFYHRVMVKFSLYSGYEVYSHEADRLTPWEAETLFNFYLKRFLEYQNIDSNAFSFNLRKDSLLMRIATNSKKELLPGNSKTRYPGIIVIMRKPTGLIVE